LEVNKWNVFGAVGIRFILNVSYQEEHPLLKAFPRELAEATEPDEFLTANTLMNMRLRRTHSAFHGLFSASNTENQLFLNVSHVHKSLTLPGMARLSMPVRSFFSSRSFWKFSIFIMVPCSCSTISEMSARVARKKGG